MLSYQMQMRKSPRRWGNHCGQHNKLAQALQKRSDSVPCLKGQTLSGREIHTEGLSIPKSGKASLVMKSENDNKGRATLPVLRLSISAKALAASASGYSPPIRTLSFPAAIQSNSCVECARNSSGSTDVIKEHGVTRRASHPK